MIDLVAFGDSWVTGEGLGQPSGEQSPMAFGNVLSSMLNARKFTNFGIAGSSNSRTVLELLKYTREYAVTENCIAIFFITTPSRNCFINNNNKIIDLPGRRGTEIEKFYITHLTSVEQDKIECFKNVLTMQQICKHHQIKDYYIIGWSDIDLNFPGIDNSKIYPKTCAQLFGYTGQFNFLESPRNQYAVDDSKHPSELGHKLIAKKLYDWISNEKT